MKILIAEPDDFSPQAISLLESIGQVTCFALPQEKISVAMTDYDIVWIRLGLTIRSGDIPRRPRCRYIISATTGLNHLDIAELQHCGVEILSLKGQVQFLENITATAEHTMGLLLSLVRMIPAAHHSVLAGNWTRDLFKGREIANRRIGIVGYGRLGKIVARYCLAMNMEVIVYDPYVLVPEGDIQSVATLEELFGTVHYVSIHIPLEPSTHGLIGERLLGMMRPGGCLINTSRGEIIVEAELLDALNEHRLAGAALDVLCEEEFFGATNPLVQYARGHDNLILTPHIGGCTWDSMEKCEDFMAQMLVERITSQ